MAIATATARSEAMSQTIHEIETMLERTARYYPADLPPDHYARRTGWHAELHWSDDGLVRFQADEYDRLDPLRRRLEVSRCHAEALLIAERLNEVILAAQEREELVERALGILPSSETGRIAEILACPELKPRRVCRSARDVTSAVGRLGEDFGPATALFYGMLILAGQRHEEEILKYADKLDRVFDRVVSAPSVITALNQPPADVDRQFDSVFPVLLAVRDQLWQIRPNRLSHEFLITQVIDAYLGDKPGGGNSLGLALLDSIIIGKLGFPVRYLIEDGILSLQVTAAGRGVFWDLTKPSALSFVPISSGRELELPDLFAVAYGSLATMCFSRSMWDKAVDSYSHEIELKPESVEAHTSMAVCFLKKQMPGEALKCLKAAIEIDPTAPEPYHQLGNAYAMMSNWPRAIDSFKKALRIRPDYVEVYNNLGFAYMRSENPTQAIAAFETAIEHRPDYYQAYYNLGNVYLEQNDAAKAIKCYKDAIRLEPKFVGAYYNLGRAYYDKQDLDGAIHSYQKAVQLNPKHFGAWHNLGIAYRDKGQTQKAVEALEKAVTINPNLMR